MFIFVVAVNFLIIIFPPYHSFSYLLISPSLYSCYILVSPTITCCYLPFVILDHLSFPLLGSSHWHSPCPSPSSRPPPRYQSGPSSLPPRATTPTRPPSRPPSRPSRPPSHSSHPSYPSSSSSFSHHGPTSPASTLPKRMSSEGSHISVEQTWAKA